MNAPPIRKDGGCACGCDKERPVDYDPFATSACARRFYGVVFEGDEDPERAEKRSEYGRMGKAAGPLSRGYA